MHIPSATSSFQQTSTSQSLLKMIPLQQTSTLQSPLKMMSQAVQQKTKTLEVDAAVISELMILRRRCCFNLQSCSRKPIRPRNCVTRNAFGGKPEQTARNGPVEDEEFAIPVRRGTKRMTSETDWESGLDGQVKRSCVYCILNFGQALASAHSSSEVAGWYRVRNVVPPHPLLQIVLGPSQKLPPSRTNTTARWGARTITHRRGVLRGPQTLMIKFPQKLNRQNPTRKTNGH